MVAVNEIERVGQAIRDAVRALNDPVLSDELGKLNRHLITQGIIPPPTTPVEPNPMAIVVSSLGGGSGSGFFLDVLATLLAVAGPEGAPWLANELVSVLYSSDVFAELGELAGPGIKPNTLAAVSELLNAAEHEDEAPVREQALLQTAGGGFDVVGRRIGPINFIVGARNKAVTFNQSREVYRAVGKALAAFMTDERVRHEFVTYVTATKEAAPMTDAFRLTGRRAQPFSSFGYANVSLGRSLFSQYASERLARAAIARILEGHREGPNKESLRPDDELIKELVRSNKDQFFARCELWEAGPENNQILDAFRDAEEREEQLDAAVRSVRSQITRKTDRMAKSDWLRFFRSSFDEHGRRYLTHQRESRDQRASEWIKPMQERLAAATAAYVGAFGIPVTLGLLESLEAQLVEAAETRGRARAPRQDGGHARRTGAWVHRCDHRPGDHRHARPARGRREGAARGAAAAERG